ncbi:TIGR03545 family protein [Flexistipes sinusarabici]|uniref:TIGR03545 family protein n=1 Tax=Flexistipes sinusarabici TaxID=2352 RepID=UPI002355DA60|nr:TIGR03545 family protein [Flexistipes sinusarabici]
MKRWIRWQGFLAFIVVIVLIAVFWFFFVDNIIKNNIEKYGSKAVGAKVEVEEADLSLIPFGLKLNNVRIANPNAPMRNVVEFERTTMSIEFGKLLIRKVIIDEMSMEGLKFNTERQKSGALSKKQTVTEEAKKDKKSELSLPSFELPEAEDILAKADLKTLDAAKELKSDIQIAKSKWQERLNSLPDKEELQGYKERIEKLKSSSGGIAGILGKAKEAASLKNDIQNNLAQIRQAIKNFKEQKNELQNKIETVTSLPAQDVNRLMDEYAFSPAGAENYTRLLFGNKAADYLNTAIYWYEKIIPYIEGGKNEEDKKEVTKIRAKGEKVYFREKEPLPRFLVKTLNADVSLEAGDLSGTIKNITSSQRILGKALTLDFSGEKLDKADSVAFTGSIDHSSANYTDIFKINTKNYRVNKITLSESSKLPVKIEKAAADINGSAEVSDGKLNMNIAAMMNDVNFSQIPGGDIAADALKTALSEISNFRIQADVNGTLDNYNMKLSSTIAQNLKSAMNKVVSSQAAQLKDELREKIMAKVEKPVENLKQEYAGLDTIQKELNSRLKIGSDLSRMLNVF